MERLTEGDSHGKNGREDQHAESDAEREAGRAPTTRPAARLRGNRVHGS